MVVVGVVACGDSDPDSATSEAPWCLADVTLPQDRDTIETMLGGLPDDINGQPRDLRPSEVRIDVFYDEPLDGMPSIQAISVDAFESAFPEAGDLTAFGLMEILLEAGAEEVDPGGVYSEPDEVVMDAESNLVWATGWTIELDTRAPSVMFADPGGRWIFNVLAATDASRVELVEAFCDVARN